MADRHPLAGVIEKLRNADFHRQRLESECLAYLNGGPNAAIAGERNPKDSTKGFLRLKVLREPPLKLAAIAGDVVHNVRSALDYIIEELVKREGHTPGFQHLFPICAKPDAFTEALNKGRLYGITPKAVKLIEGLQPYHVKPEALNRHPLLHLHKLSNRDKHHMLAIAALNASFVWKFVGQDGRVLRSEQTTESVVDGGVLAEVPIEFVIDGQKAQLQSQITIQVGFTESTFDGFDVAACLENICVFVGEFMVPGFVKLFFDPLPDDLILAVHKTVVQPSKPMSVLVRANPNEQM